MKIKPKELYNLIEANNYRSVRVYEGVIKDDLTNYMSFETVFRTTSKELIERINELESILSGDFTLALGNGSKTQKIKHCKKVVCEFYKTTILKPETSTVYESTDSIEYKVKKLVEQKLNEIEQENKVQELEKKLEELETWGGKLNYLLTNFLNSYLQNMNAGTLQGIENENNIENITDLEKSIVVLVDFIGQKNIVRLAQKIQSGQANAVKPIIINFINS